MRWLGRTSPEQPASVFFLLELCCLTDSAADEEVTLCPSFWMGLPAPKAGDYSGASGCVDAAGHEPARQGRALFMFSNPFFVR
jgi:hypothetical protein